MDKYSRRTKERFLCRAQKMAEVMERRKLQVEICANEQEAVERILSLIPENETVACKESRTLREWGLTEKLREGEYQYMEQTREASIEERCRQLEQMSQSNVYITEVHAISLDGTFVITEKTGSRIAAMTFGADRVIVIAGINKLCRNEKAAVRCARKAAGLDSNYLLSVRGCMIPGRIRVVLVAEYLRD